ncbi:MAG: translation initiation inhibitor [Candidatus Hydrogenedentes bacterium]|nr:translation initiation inhibitor [Candidatus Hydrogenedentota bacterium]
MESFSIDCGVLPASVSISRFRGQDGVDEYHVMVRPTDYGSFSAQLEWLSAAYQNALDALELDAQSTVLRRFFCSDLSNQTAALEARPFSNPSDPDTPCAVSWTRQPPGGSAKVALWAYHLTDPESDLDKTLAASAVTLRRGALAHHWTTGRTSTNQDLPYDQTRGILESYDAILQAHSMSLAHNVVRTWFFVQNIDSNYSGFVAARREFFAQHGLTPDTHFVASTGVDGAHADTAAKVAMDAYAISGIRPEQIAFLAAPEHLSPTQLYGVTFERGTSVAYRDRKHVFISGTASIDHQGRILYPGNVSRQLDRTLENIDALLKSAGSDFKDMCMFIVYVRDASDYEFARQRMRELFGDTPLQVVVAPVCRPGWLIEVEGIAIVPASNPELPAF